MGYSQEDERIIGEQFDKLMASCAKICKNEYDKDLIQRAFFLAKRAASCFANQIVKCLLIL